MNKYWVIAVLACAALATAGMAAASSDELQRLFVEDQADRAPASGNNIDWEAVGVRDETRERRVKELVRAGALKSGADYYHAAMILQHAPEPDDYLLAHDLCVIAIGKGEQRAKSLAAA